jgi:hypothetical protein
MTIEQMWQKASEVRKAAKALQQKLQTVTNPVERRQLARQMNELFNQASALRNETKHRRWFEKSIEREFLSMKANLEDD